MEKFAITGIQTCWQCSKSSIFFFNLDIQTYSQVMMASKLLLNVDCSELYLLYTITQITPKPVWYKLVLFLFMTSATSSVFSRVTLTSPLHSGRWKATSPKLSFHGQWPSIVISTWFIQWVCEASWALVIGGFYDDPLYTFDDLMCLRIVLALFKFSSSTWLSNKLLSCHNSGMKERLSRLFI